MKLNIAFPDQNRFVDAEVPDDLSLEEFKSYLEAETGIPPLLQLLEHESALLLRDSDLLGLLGLKDHDSLVLHVKPKESELDPRFSAFEQLRQQALVNPQIRAQLAPEARSVLRSAREFASAMLKNETAAQQRYADEMRALQNDQFLEQGQKKLMDMIRRERIQQNLQLAYEITPEAFVNTTLLLIKLNINGHDTHALVDSGAQKSVILAPVAESFGLHDLIDTAFAGMSRGVGQQQSPGRIHSVPVVLGDTNLALPCAFQVLEIGFPVLLGLDMLKAHRCIIDLSKNALVVGQYEIPFMPEHEVEKLSLAMHDDPKNAIGAVGSIATNEVAQKPAAQNAPSIPERTPTASSATTSSSAAHGQNPLPSVPEDSITQLCSLGFSRQEAVEALQISNGNVELAAGYLFQ